MRHVFCYGARIARGTGWLAGALLLVAAPAWAQDLGAAMERLADSTESSFGIIDAVVYLVGLIVVIGGVMALKGGPNKPPSVRAGIIAVLVGLAILGWKGWTDAFYDSVGIDPTTPSGGRIVERAPCPRSRRPSHHGPGAGGRSALPDQAAPATMTKDRDLERGKPRCSWRGRIAGTA